MKVSRKHQIAVPAKFRRQLDINAGDRLSVEVRDGTLVLRPQRMSAADELREIGKDFWPGFDGIKLLNELRDEWTQREEQLRGAWSQER